MQLLNSSFSAIIILNILCQLFSVSLIGWFLVQLLRKKAAVYRSAVSTTVMTTLLLVIIASIMFQFKDFSWNKPVLAIKQKGNEYMVNHFDKKMLISSDAKAAHVLPTAEAGKAASSIVQSTTSLNQAELSPLYINCFGILWLVGFMFLVAKFFYSLIFLKGFTAATVTELDHKYKQILQDVCNCYRFKTTPAVFISKAIPSPIAIGLFRISVFIPENLYENISEDEFRSILYHEFAHIHHLDHLFGVFNRLVLAINWWNPLVYYISNEQSQAREDICDNYAIKGLKSATAYSNCLVNLAEKICLISNYPATAGMAGNKSNLELRIKRIFSNDRSMLTKLKAYITCLILTASLLATIFAGGLSIAYAQKINQDQGLQKLEKEIVASEIPEIPEMAKSQLVDSQLGNYCAALSLSKQEKCELKKLLIQANKYTSPASFRKIGVLKSGKAVQKTYRQINAFLGKERVATYDKYMQTKIAANKNIAVRVQIAKMNLGLNQKQETAVRKMIEEANKEFTLKKQGGTVPLDQFNMVYPWNNVDKRINSLRNKLTSVLSKAQMDKFDIWAEKERKSSKQMAKMLEKSKKLLGTSQNIKLPDYKEVDILRKKAQKIVNKRVNQQLTEMDLDLSSKQKEDAAKALKSIFRHPRIVLEETYLERNMNEIDRVRNKLTPILSAKQKEKFEKWLKSKISHIKKMAKMREEFLK